MDPNRKACPLSKKKPTTRVRTAEEVKMDQALKKYYSKDLFSLPPERPLPDNEFMLEGRRQMEERELNIMNQTTEESEECTTDELEWGEVPQDEVPEDLRRKIDGDRKKAKMDSFNPYEEREKKFKKLQSFGYPPQNVTLKMYKCELISCERKFFNLYDYMDHKRLHEIGDSPPFICPVCGSRYDKLKRCAIHLSVHRNKGETRAPGSDFGSGHLIMSKAPHPKKPMTQLDADFLLAKKLQEEEDEAAKKIQQQQKQPAATQSSSSNLEFLASVAEFMESQSLVAVEVMEDTEFQFDPVIVSTQGSVSMESAVESTHGTIEVVEVSTTPDSMPSQSCSGNYGNGMTPEEQLLADFLLAQSLQEEEDNISRNDYLARANNIKEELNKTQVILQDDVETEIENDSDFDLNASEKLQMDLLAAKYNAERRAAGSVVESSSQDSEMILDID